MNQQPLFQSCNPQSVSNQFSRLHPMSVAIWPSSFQSAFQSTSSKQFPVAESQQPPVILAPCASLPASLLPVPSPAAMSLVSCQTALFLATSTALLVWQLEQFCLHGKPTAQPPGGSCFHHCPPELLSRHHRPHERFCTPVLHLGLPSHLLCPLVLSADHLYATISKILIMTMLTCLCLASYVYHVEHLSLDN